MQANKTKQKLKTIIETKTNKQANRQQTNPKQEHHHIILLWSLRQIVNPFVE